MSGMMRNRRPLRGAEVTGGLAPIIGDDPAILVLGSSPSVMSLEKGEYYGNPRNHFWQIMERIAGVPADAPYAERTSCLKQRRIALWDVLCTCERHASCDQSIRNPLANDIAGLLEDHPTIVCIALNGKVGATRWMRQLLPEVMNRTDIRIVSLPSTSPANARLSLEEKAAAWAVIMTCIEEE
jgi:TDG/mug DNA glycosylase family protein